MPSLSNPVVLICVNAFLIFTSSHRGSPADECVPIISSYIVIREIAVATLVAFQNKQTPHASFRARVNTASHKPVLKETLQSSRRNKRNVGCVTNDVGCHFARKLGTMCCASQILFPACRVTSRCPLARPRFDSGFAAVTPEQISSCLGRRTQRRDRRIGVFTTGPVGTVMSFLAPSDGGVTTRRPEVDAQSPRCFRATSLAFCTA